MPPLLTYAARVSDGLPLVASMTASSEIGEDHKSQAKELLRGLGGRAAAAKMSINTTQSKVFLYLIRDNICYLTLTESSYPKRLAFLYLEEIADVFMEALTQDHGDAWRNQVETAARPYQFIKFDSIIQRKQREFIDPTSRANTTKLNEDLMDIQSIMKKNIEEVLNRGEKLENVRDISSNLVEKSKEFKWGAKKVTWQAQLNQYGPIAAAGLFVVFVLYMKFFW
uniref:V-SNARE coiled-coil homology domain-containing protein n=1 Tax=Helicotheca tamesis TaxID=374047 RepID=A0A7S2HJ05_9STRA|mmetsp:Transcript_18576/g.25562  ORF Transcript_18576/g.25562 Transcript_18576/m.25562 type:complete len:225 (+) Transcript_18576:101-775(+)